MPYRGINYRLGISTSGERVGYVVCIGYRGRSHRIGLFSDEEAAARAYDFVVTQRKEFETTNNYTKKRIIELNFPDETQEWPAHATDDDPPDWSAINANCDSFDQQREKAAAETKATRKSRSKSDPATRPRPVKAPPPFATVGAVAEVQHRCGDWYTYEVGSSACPLSPPPSARAPGLTC